PTYNPMAASRKSSLGLNRLIPQRRIYFGRQALASLEGFGYFDGVCADALAYGVGRVSKVWSNHAVDLIPQWVSIGQRFRVGDIEAGTADDAVFKGFGKSIGIHQRAAADVNHHGVLRHLLQGIRVDHVVGLRG